MESKETVKCEAATESKETATEIKLTAAESKGIIKTEDSAAVKVAIRPVQDGKPREFLLEMPEAVLHRIAGFLSISEMLSVRLTCKQLNVIFTVPLLKRDIKSRRYNSLYWACRWPNMGQLLSDLMNESQVLATPNVAFCRRRTKEDPLPDVVFFQKAACVHPTLRLYGESILQGPPCSPLTLATQYDNLDAMKHLLQHGAAPFEHHLAPSLPTTKRSEVLDLIPHPSPLAYVRSISAAKLLIEHGAVNGIMDLGHTGLTPLEMILYRAEREKGSPSAMNETELYNLVKYLVSQGAPVHRMVGAGAIPHPGAPGKLHSSPLFAAVALRSVKICRLLLESRQYNLYTPTHEFERMKKMALDLLPLIGSEYAHDLKFCKSLLDLLVTVRPPGPKTMRQLMTIAIEDGNLDAMRILLDRGADPNLTARGTDGFPTAICEIMISRSPKAEKLQTPMLGMVSQYGANPNKLSYIEQRPNKPSGKGHTGQEPLGLSPLFLAAFEGVPATAFSYLLRARCSLAGSFRLTSEGVPLTVVQCLVLQPYLLDEEDWDAAVVGSAYYEKLMIKKGDHGTAKKAEREAHQLRQTRQSSKLNAIIKQFQRPHQFFRTSENVHVLNWIVSAAPLPAMLDAISLLTPLYSATATSEDLCNPPILQLFSRERFQDTMRFGTLHLLVEVTRALVQEPFPEKAWAVSGETILHRLCQLKPTLGNESEWNRFLTHHDSPKNEIISLEVRKAIGQTLGTGAISPQRLKYEHLLEAREEYVAERRASIVKLIKHVLEVGRVNPLAKDQNGRKAIQYTDDVDLKFLMGRYEGKMMSKAVVKTEPKVAVDVKMEDA